MWLGFTHNPFSLDLVHVALTSKESLSPAFAFGASVSPLGVRVNIYVGVQ